MDYVGLVNNLSCMYTEMWVGPISHTECVKIAVQSGTLEVVRSPKPIPDLPDKPI